MTKTAMDSPQLNKECLSRFRAKYEEAKELVRALGRDEADFQGRPIHAVVGYWNDAVCQMITSCFGPEEDAAVRFKEGFEEFMLRAPELVASSSAKYFHQQLATVVSLRAIEIEGLISRMENAIILPSDPSQDDKASEAVRAGAAGGKGDRRGCVILTALAVEHAAVCSHIEDVDEVVHKGTVYDRGTFASAYGGWEVYVAELGAGNDSAAFELERAVSHFEPEIVMFVGVAGGIKDVRVGDVVVATKVYGYESGKAEAKFRPRPDVGNSSYKMVQRAKAVARRGEWVSRIADAGAAAPRAFVGAMAAGEKVIASTESSVYRFLRESYGDALAVEMEGRGFLEAAHANPHVSTLIVRGISDLLDNKSDLDDDIRQAMASRHASAFAFEVLSQLGRDSS
jgi:nucleoside phosphorylase